MHCPTNMLQRTYAVAAIAAVPALISLAAPRETVRFSPSQDLSLEKTFSIETEMVLDEMDMLMNGNPLPMDMQMDMTVSSARTINVIDTYRGRIEDGQPTKLHRSFVELSEVADMSMSAMMMEPQEMSMEMGSELEGLGVTFTLSDGEYEVAFDDESDGDDELLEGLAEDMDLRALLPAGEVAVGDEWRIDTTSLADVLAPGGDLTILPSDSEMEEMGGMMPGGVGMDMRQMLGEVDGEATATLTAVEGSRATITVAIEIEAFNDLSEMVREMMDDAEMPEEVGSMEIESVDIELSLEAEGTLVWDLEAGHFVEFNLSSSMEVTMDQAMSMEAQGQSMSMEQSMVFSSTSESNYTAEAL
jgi:hypothetical protein